MSNTQGKDLYSKKYNIRFYHVTKNGMTSMIKTLSLDWVVVEDIDTSAKTIAIIRDPFERFISGFLYINSGCNVNDYLDKLLNEGSWDGHNFPQHYFLNQKIHKRNISDVDHFILFEDISNELKNIGISNIEHLNRGSTIMKNRNRDIIIHRKTEILDFYIEDFHLWQHIKQEKEER